MSSITCYQDTIASVFDVILSITQTISLKHGHVIHKHMGYKEGRESVPDDIVQQQQAGEGELLIWLCR